MKPSIILGHVFGVQIGLHFSWFIITALICMVLARRFYVAHPDWSTEVVWITTIVTALLFFVTLLMHEMSHALMARAFGLPVHSITLFALGGVANIEKEATTAKAEFSIGAVGPLTSAVIGAVCLGAASAMGWSPPDTATTPVAAALGWLGYINIALAVFNMIPGFPMDGGRVLKAVVWWFTGDQERSSHLAARGGQVVAMLFIIGGMVLLIATGSFSGLWLAIIGWFLITAATASMMQSELMSSLRDVAAGDAMEQSWSSAPADMSLNDFVQQKVLRSANRFFLVHSSSDPYDIEGLVTVHDIAKVPKPSWGFKRLDEVMVPIEKAHTISSEAPLVNALEVMGKQDVDQMPVLSGKRVVGVLTKDNIAQLFKNRSELKKRLA